jgi:hypothetical protein
MHIFCTYRQKWMQRGKKDSKNKIKRLRGDTDTRLHQVICHYFFLSFGFCNIVTIFFSIVWFLQHQEIHG